MLLVIDLSNGDLGLIVAALAAAGLVVGFLSGLLGIGGGGILVPVLYETFAMLDVPPQIRMHMALATTLAIIIPTSFRSYAAHRAKGSVDGPLLERLAPWVVGGVILGIVLADRVASSTLIWFWIVFGTVMALKMGFGRDTWRLGDDIPKGYGVEAFAVFLGFASVLISIGGAAFVVALMTLYARPVTQAVGTSSGFGPLIAIPGVAGYIWAGWDIDTGLPLSLGYVSLLAAALVIPTGMLLAPVGVRIAHGIPRRRLEQAFAIFLALVVARFLWIQLGTP
ncbi:MAG: sulfite exporter TauE/SafE family protein [Hyphomicrobiaceae bacterium]